MLELIVDNRLIYVVAGGVTALGVVSKIISNLSLKRMVKAAGNMSKSNHALMRLVRAKFEHACMVSEKVENVQAFVDKFLYEFKTFGLKLHTWRRIQLLCVVLCLTLGALGAFLEYSVNGMGNEVIRIGAYGGILGVLLYLFHLTSDENYRLNAARNYMVDYLENVCLHKYGKIYQKEEVKEAKPVASEGKACKDSEQEPVRPHPAKEVPTTIPAPELDPPTMPEPYRVPEVAKENLKEVYKREEKKPEKDVLIRQILEEFMA